MAKYSKVLVDKIISMIEEDNYSVSSICRIIGITRKSFYNWKASKPEFAQALDEAFETREDELRTKARCALRRRIEGYIQITNRTTYVPSKDDPAQLEIKQHVVTEKFCEPDINTIMRLIDSGKSVLETETSKKTRMDMTLMVTKAEQETKNDLLHVPTTAAAATETTETTGTAELPIIDTIAPPDNNIESIETPLISLPPILFSASSPVSSIPSPAKVNAEDMAKWQQQLTEECMRQQQKTPSITRAVPPPLRGIAYK